MLLVGLAGAPFLWAGVPPAVVHNGLLIAAFATSAWAMYALAWRLTADRGAACLAAVIVGFAPYRFAHIAHLELQWLAWMPLALLALHELVASPRPRVGFALGACLAGQLLCSIYYGVFLALFLAVAWIGLVVAHGARPRLVAATATAAIPLALVAIPYLWPYAASRSAHAPRTADEVAEYSATPGDYLRVPRSQRPARAEGRRAGAGGALAVSRGRGDRPGAVRPVADAVAHDLGLRRPGRRRLRCLAGRARHHLPRAAGDRAAPRQPARAGPLRQPRPGDAGRSGRLRDCRHRAPARARRRGGGSRRPVPRRRVVAAARCATRVSSRCWSIAGWRCCPTTP